MRAAPPIVDATTRGRAIAGLAVGVVGVLLGAAGLTVAIVALVQARAAKRELKRLRKEP